MERAASLMFSHYLSFTIEAWEQPAISTSTSQSSSLIGEFPATLPLIMMENSQTNFVRICDDFFKPPPDDDEREFVSDTATHGPETSTMNILEQEPFGNDNHSGT